MFNDSCNKLVVSTTTLFTENQLSKGIRQWPINWCKYPMMMNNINNYWTPNWITNQSNQTFGTKETAQCPLSPCWIQIKCFSYACLPCWFLHMYFEENYSNNLCIKVVAYKKRYSTTCSFMPWSFDLKKYHHLKNEWDWLR